MTKSDSQTEDCRPRYPQVSTKLLLPQPFCKVHVGVENERGDDLASFSFCMLEKGCRGVAVELDACKNSAELVETLDGCELL